MYIGIDIGSTKAASCLIDADRNVVYSVIVPTNSNMKSAGDECFSRCVQESGVPLESIKHLIVTGYGRKVLHPACSYSEITEIMAIAKGVYATEQNACTIIDIGGQDSKAIRIDDRGCIVDFRMNDMCAAGTGRFIENIARILEIPLDGIGEISLSAVEPVVITSMCAVFAESEVISMLSQGVTKQSILAGLFSAIAKRVVNLAMSIGIEGAVTFTGGVAKNTGIAKYIEEELGTAVRIAPSSRLIAAYGSALAALESELKRGGSRA